MKTFAVYTLGCKVNSYESEALKLLMLERGYQYQDVAPDIAIINTCSVTNMSAKKSRQMMHRFVHANPHVILAIMGCYSQIDQSMLDLPNVGVLIGTSMRHLIPDLLEKYLTTGIKQVQIEANVAKSEYEELKVTSYSDRTRAYVKIQDGCDNFCSYCIIPYARGRLRSRPKDDVLTEIGTLVGRGYQEIVLTGIHTAGYGRDLTNYSFDDLLNDIFISFPTLYRLRISSIEASEITSRFLTMLRQEPRMARHLHIPLQSGSDEILTKMNRHYSRQQFIDKIDEIYALLPDIAITTDIIVGFPGETETMFMDTFNVAKQLKFAKIHVFPYSPRAGTHAAKYHDEVAINIKKARVERLLTLSHELEDAYALRFIGQPLSLVIEQYDEKRQAYEGHSSNYLKAYVRKDDLIRGSIVTIIYAGITKISPIQTII